MHYGKSNRILFAFHSKEVFSSFLFSLAFAAFTLVSRSSQKLAKYVVLFYILMSTLFQVFRVVLGRYTWRV